MVVVLSACHGENASDPIRLEFRGLVDGQPFACGESFTGIGASEASIEPLDFRLYLHAYDGQESCRLFRQGPGSRTSGSRRRS